LVERVVDDEKALDGAVEEWVGRLVGMGPKAIRSQKELMRRWEGGTVEEGIMAGVDAYAEAYGDGGVEPREMMGRFLSRNRRTGYGLG
jgi:enoyl-CoA hydratase/carnithine racemase